MAYKDEYEVARLHTDTGFLDRIAAQFEGDYQVNLHLAPPLWAKPDPVTGEARKRQYGPWMFSLMRLLAKMKGVRGTALDVFGYSEERRTERALIAAYEETVSSLLEELDADRLSLAVDIASIPEHIRGYGHVKARHLADAKKREAELKEMWRNPDGSQGPLDPDPRGSLNRGQISECLCTAGVQPMYAGGLDGIGSPSQIKRLEVGIALAPCGQGRCRSCTVRLGW
jgi:hypothetical protein